MNKPIEQTNHHQQINKLASCNKLLQSDKVQHIYHVSPCYHKSNSSTSAYPDYHNSNSYTTFHLATTNLTAVPQLIQTTTTLTAIPHPAYTTIYLTAVPKLTQTTTSEQLYPVSQKTTTNLDIPQYIHHTENKDTLKAIKIPGHKLPRGHIPLSLPRLNPPKFLSEQHANTSSVEFAQPLANVNPATNFSASSRKIFSHTYSIRIHPLLPS